MVIIPNRNLFGNLEVAFYRIQCFQAGVLIVVFLYQMCFLIPFCLPILSQLNIIFWYNGPDKLRATCKAIRPSGFILEC